VDIRARLGNSSTLSYLFYVLFLAGTIYYLATATYHGQGPSPFEGLPNLFLVTMIFAIISLRGLIVRVRYAFFLAIATLVATLVPILLLIDYFSIFTFPLLAVSIITIVLLIRDYRYFNFPTRLFDRPEISISIVIIVIVLLIGVAGTLSLGNQFSPRITNVSRALYYTGEVVTTLGFGDILPITRTSQIFSIIMSILGIGSFFGAVTVIVGPSIYERGRKVVGVIQKIESKMMDNYVLFVDFNPLFDSLLNDLIEKDELVIVAIDDKSKEALLTEKKVFLESDGTMEKLMASLDLRRAKRIVLGCEDDGRNIMNALYIISTYPGEEVKKKMISIVNVASNATRIRSLVGDIINPANLIAEHSKTLF